MIRTTTATLLFMLLAGNSFADGFSPMPLKKVLLKTDTIILVEIVKNEQTITHKNKGAGNLREVVVYANDIKSKVIAAPVGKFAGAEYNTRYSLSLVKGVWLAIPGSGQEGRMTPGEKYLFLLKRNGGDYTLQRAEKADMLKEVLRIKKKQDDEDRRVAREQAKIPNGIYNYSDQGDAQKIRLQDGRRVRLGAKCDLNILRRELHSLYDTATLIELSLTLTSGKPKPCILMIGGKAHWLYDHSGNAVFMGYTPGATKPPSLHCSFNNRKDAEAVAKFFKISIFHRQPQSNKVAKKKTDAE